MRKVEIYAGRRGLLRRKQWRARLVEENSFGREVLFVSAEGYNNRAFLSDLCDDVFPGVPTDYNTPGPGE